MTTFEEPHLGWHTVAWGNLRRWWVHREEHKSGDLNKNHQWHHRTDDDPEPADVEVDPPEQDDPEEPEAAPARWQRWTQAAKTVGFWCVGSLVLVVVTDPASWLLALVIGCAGAGLVLQHAAHQRTVEVLAHQVERERAELASRAKRVERREQNRAANEEARAALYEEARAAREAKKAANRGSETP